MGSKKILMVIAQKNFRFEEFFEPKRIFEENGFEVVVASKKAGICQAVPSGEFESQVCVYDIKSSEFLAIVFVGGFGALMYENDERINNLISDFLDEKKLVCAICIAPRILINANVLENKKFTMWNQDESQNNFIKNSGGIFTGKNVESDDNIITANGPMSAKEFGEIIISKLKEF
jgi:protease I